MKIICGDERIDIRPWGGEGSGKALIMTRDDAVKIELTMLMAGAPGAVELLTDPDIESDADDMEINGGLMMAVVDRTKVAVLFELEEMKIGFCSFEGE